MDPCLLVPIYCDLHGEFKKLQISPKNEFSNGGFITSPYDDTKCYYFVKENNIIFLKNEKESVDILKNEAIQCSTSNSLLLIFGLRNSEIICYDLNLGVKIVNNLPYNTGYPTSLHIVNRNNSLYCFVGTSTGYLLTYQIINNSTGKEIKLLQDNENFKESITSMLYIDNMDAMALGFTSGYLKIWSIQTKSLLYESQSEIDTPIYKIIANSTDNFIILGVVYGYGHCSISAKKNSSSAVAIYWITPNKTMKKISSHNIQSNQVCTIIDAFLSKSDLRTFTLFVSWNHISENDHKICFNYYHLYNLPLLTEEDTSEVLVQKVALDDFLKQTYHERFSVIASYFTIDQSISYFPRLKFSSSKLMVEDNLKNMKRCPVIPTLHLLLSSGEIFSVYLGIPSQSWSWKIKTKGWTALHYSDSTKNFYNVDESYNSAIELGLLHSEKRMESIEKQEDLFNLCFEYNLSYILRDYITDIAKLSYASEKYGLSERIFKWALKKFKILRSHIELTKFGIRKDYKSTISELIETRNRLSDLEMIASYLMKIDATKQGRDNLSSFHSQINMTKSLVQLQLFFIGDFQKKETSSEFYDVSLSEIQYSSADLRSRLKSDVDQLELLEPTTINKFPSFSYPRNNLLIDTWMKALEKSLNIADNDYKYPRQERSLWNFVYALFTGKHEIDFKNIQHRYCTILYLLLEKFMSPEVTTYKNIDTIKEYIDTFSITYEYSEMIFGFWLLDHFSYQEGVIHIINALRFSYGASLQLPFINYWYWHVLYVLTSSRYITCYSSIFCREYELAYSVLKSAKGAEPSTLRDLSLLILIYCKSTPLKDSLDLVRKYLSYPLSQDKSNETNIEPDQKKRKTCIYDVKNETVFIYFLNCCYNCNLIKQLLLSRLSDTEEELLKKFCEDKDTTKKGYLSLLERSNFLLGYYIHHGKFVEALKKSVADENSAWMITVKSNQLTSAIQKILKDRSILIQICQRLVPEYQFNSIEPRKKKQDHKQNTINDPAHSSYPNSLESIDSQDYMNDNNMNSISESMNDDSMSEEEEDEDFV